jgi:hypothetical protein
VRPAASVPVWNAASIAPALNASMSCRD